jgi:hypothetical protein
MSTSSYVNMLIWSKKPSTILDCWTKETNQSLLWKKKQLRLREICWKKKNSSEVKTKSIKNSYLHIIAMPKTSFLNNKLIERQANSLKPLTKNLRWLKKILLWSCRNLMLIKYNVALNWRNNWNSQFTKEDLLEDSKQNGLVPILKLIKAQS